MSGKWLSANNAVSLTTIFSHAPYGLGGTQRLLAGVRRGGDKLWGIRMHLKSGIRLGLGGIPNTRFPFDVIESYLCCLWWYVNVLAFDNGYQRVLVKGTVGRIKWQTVFYTLLGEIWGTAEVCGMYFLNKVCKDIIHVSYASSVQWFTEKNIAYFSIWRTSIEMFTLSISISLWNCE